MTFTDDDLKRLKEHLEGSCYVTTEWFDARKLMPALLARLEAAEVCISNGLLSPIDESTYNAWLRASGKAGEK